jgi:branched-chain amino acid transport system permease protein
MTTLLPGVDLMVGVFYFGLFAMSFDFISGYTGYLSFGHAAFYGIGAYFVVLVANGKIPFLPSSTPFLLLLVLGGLLAAVFAVLVGAVSFRLSGVYFAMITLGVSQVVFVLMSNWDYLGSNPRTGIAVQSSVHPEGFRIGVPFVDALSLQVGRLVGDSLALGALSLSSTTVSYYLVGLVVLVCYLAMQRMIHSPFGRVMVAIRENEERARAVGYNTFRYKLTAFALSAFFAAVAGGLFAGYRRSVAPDNSLFFLVAGDALLAAIIGGFGTLAGPFFGWFLFQSLEEFLSKGVSGGHPDGFLPYVREALGSSALSTELPGGATLGSVLEVLFNGRAPLYIGVVFVLFVLYVPDGLLGTLRARIGGTLAKRLPAYLGDRLGFEEGLTGRSD